MRTTLAPLCRSSVVTGILTALLGMVLALALTPARARAEKLPVDCSGIRTSCKEITRCIEEIGVKCRTIERVIWYWYR